MIAGADDEIYVRLFPKEAERLVADLIEAENRGVAVKSIFMKPYPETFRLQVVHPQSGHLEAVMGGRSFVFVVDKREFLGGIIEAGKEEQARIHWGSNRWSVTSGRDSLRHDFFHYLLVKLYERKASLTPQEEALYRILRQDT